MNKNLLTFVFWAAGSTLLPAQPVITVQPTNQIVLNGSNTVFKVTATGSGLLSYQWRFNGTEFEGWQFITVLLGAVRFFIC